MNDHPTDVIDTIRRRETHPVHLEAWEWLLERIPWYPPEQKMWPWTRAKKNDRWRPIAMVGVAVANGPVDHTYLPTGVQLWTPERSETVRLEGETTDAARVAQLLFNRQTRGFSLVCLYGAALDLNGILRWWARSWVEQGYRLLPIVAGNTCRAIIVRHGRQRWTLCDVEAMTGTPIEDAKVEAYDRLKADSDTIPVLRAVWEWLADLQTHTMREYGAYLRPTIGGTGMRIAGFNLPEERSVPRPSPILVALCRAGLGFRGGYVYGTRYQGEATMIDCRRMYAHALREELPCRWSLGHGVADGGLKQGIFMCSVSGTPLHPVQLGVWCGPGEGFVRKLWHGGRCVAVLPSTEYAGLRAMGLTVTPGWGMVGWAPHSFAPLVERIGRVLEEHGSGSPIGRLSKLIANTTYGKMAMRSDRETIIYSIDRPHERAFPAVTVEGDELADLWTLETRIYTAYQQIGMASFITGFARSHLYLEMARHLEAGRRVVHAHTDGFVITGAPPAEMVWDTDTIGAWRIVATDAMATVVRGGGYVLNDDPKWSGGPHWGRHE
ncbi:MAG: hypothetical protein EBT09_09640, partial [Actinobacteria bacterium]|nr:hypothetical protein [Actinomycetota bacterium]